MSTRPQHLYEFGPYRLDTAERLLLRDGEPVPLTPKAFEMLVALVQRSGHLVEKDELMKVVWADAFVEESNLTNNVYALRKTLGRSKNGRNYIETVPKRGYRFTAPVKELPTETLVVERRSVTRVVTEETVRDDSPQRPMISAGEALAIEHVPFIAVRRSQWSWLLIALLSLSLIVAGMFIYRSLTSDRSLTAAPRPQIESIAVLPFTNESGNPDVEYLSDGVTESLINRLAQLPQLKVIARNSAFVYKSKEMNPEEVSRALGVQAILLGRIAKRDDSLIVSVELMDARDKTQVWGERYTRKTADIQALQEDIARTVSEKLRLRLRRVQEQQLTKRATQNPQAYEAYLTGIFYFRKPGLEGIRKSLDYFNQAVALDPNFALAWVEIARVHTFFAGRALADSREEFVKARMAAQRASDIDESLAEAHVELARCKDGERDWAGAEHEYERALALNPNLADAHGAYSSYLSIMGRDQEALAEIKRAQELDPLRIGLRQGEVWCLMAARRYDEAIEKQKQYMDMNPGHGFSHVALGLLYEAKGLYQEAIKEYGKAKTILGETTSVEIYLGYALAMTGQRSKSQAIFDKLSKGKEYVAPSELAYFHIAWKDKEAAMALLEKAYAARDPHLRNLKIDPHYDTLRTDPRFQNLLRRVGLMS